MGMFDTDQLGSMRDTVEETLSDTCAINEQGADTLNATTGAYTYTAGAQVYTGACRFGALNVSDQVVEVGGEPVSLRTFQVRLPWDTVGIEVDQVITATVSNDAHLQGRTMRVVDVRGMTDPLSRSVIAEDNLG